MRQYVRDHQRCDGSLCHLTHLLGLFALRAEVLTALFHHFLSLVFYLLNEIIINLHPFTARQIALLRDHIKLVHALFLQLRHPVLVLNTKLLEPPVAPNRDHN